MNLTTVFKDIKVFHRLILPVLNPELETQDGFNVPDFHYELYNNLNKPERLQLLVAPVGFAKSTILKIFALHEILVKQADKYCIYVSSTDTKAVEHIGAIQKILKQPFVQAVFSYKILSLNTHEVTIEMGKHKFKIEAVASGADIAGKNYEGARPSLIIVDDLEDLEQANSPERTNKLQDWLFTILISRLPSLTTGRVRMINTVLSLDSLTNRILGKAPNIDPNNKNQFDDFATYYYQALDQNEKSIWEERHPTQFLLKERSLRPHIFARNYMNAPFDSSYTMIKNEYLQYYNSVNLDDFEELCLHADLTHTAKTTSDFFCIAVVGKSKVDNNFYVIDFDLRKDLTPLNQIQSVIAFFQKYPKIKQGTFDEQSNDWFGEQFQIEAKRQNLYLNLKGVKFHKDKISHLNLHIDKVTTKSLVLPRNHPLIGEATQQLLTFPVGKHDDFLDGILGGLDQCVMVSRIPTIDLF
jgi:phage terminase large subunit-like protein